MSIQCFVDARMFVVCNCYNCLIFSLFFQLSITKHLNLTDLLLYDMSKHFIYTQYVMYINVLLFLLQQQFGSLFSIVSFCHPQIVKMLSWFVVMDIQIYSINNISFYILYNTPFYIYFSSDFSHHMHAYTCNSNKKVKEKRKNSDKYKSGECML